MGDLDIEQMGTDFKQLSEHRTTTLWAFARNFNFYNWELVEMKAKSGIYR